jgi:hypothetical protein
MDVTIFVITTIVKAKLLSCDRIEGKKHSEDSPAAAFLLSASETQGALMAVDDLAAYPEPEPRTVDTLGGVEGLKHPALNRARHTFAGVGDGNDNTPSARTPVCALASAQQQPATLRMD